MRDSHGFASFISFDRFQSRMTWSCVPSYLASRSICPATHKPVWKMDNSVLTGTIPRAMKKSL
jgi:hypothetical protein